MLFGRYNLVIFKEGRSGSRNLHLRGWLVLMAFLFVGAVIACNVWLWRQYLEAQHLQTELSDAREVIAEQRRSTVNLAEKISTLSHDWKG